MAPSHMSDGEAISTQVTGIVNIDVDLRDSTPPDAWVSRPVAESVNEAMERAPLGAINGSCYRNIVNLVVNTYVICSII